MRTARAEGERVSASDCASSACCAATVAAAALPAGRTFRVQGLDCADEVRALQAALGSLVGGEDRLAFDILNARMTIAPSAAHIADESIAAAVACTGMRAERESTQRASADGEERRHWTQVWLTALSGIGVAVGFCCMSGSRAASATR
jgi:Cd2+/Zn2+-exporting ATPase